MSDSRVRITDGKYARPRIGFRCWRNVPEASHDIAVVTRLRLTLYRPWIRATAPWRYASNTCGAAALIGRLIRPAMKCGTNTIESGRSLEIAKSRNSIDLPLMTNPDVLDVLDVLSRGRDTGTFCDRELVFHSSSAGW